MVERLKGLICRGEELDLYGQFVDRGLKFWEILRGCLVRYMKLREGELPALCWVMLSTNVVRCK